MSDNNKKKGFRKLTLHLLRKGKEPEDVLKPGCKSLQHLNNNARIKKLNGTKPGNVPEWADAYDMTDEEATELSFPRPYGLIFVQFKENVKSDEEKMEVDSDDSIPETGNRRMVVSHGCGRELLKLNEMVPQFGLIFTLNSVNLITLTNTKSLTVASHNVTDYHPKGADINQFEMLELLKAMKGKEFECNEDKNVPARKRHVKISMEGNDVLKIKFWDNKEVSIAELPELCKEYYAKFLEDTYIKRYPSLKNFLPVYDNDIIQELEVKMVKSIQQYMKNGKFNDSDYMDLSYPWTEKPVNCENVKFMNFANGRGRKEPCELDLENYIIAIRNNFEEIQLFRSGGSEDILKRLEKHQVQLCCLNKDDLESENNQNQKRKWCIKKCIIYDTKFKEKHYIFIDSSWYLLDSDYITTLKNNFINKLKPSTLPPYTENCSELKYNTFACNANDYLLMDNVSIKIGDDGRSQFEFCDCLTTEPKIYHVKKYGQLSEFGYVFSQAENSAFLIQTDYTVYEKVCLAVKEKCKESENTLVKEKADEYLKAMETLKINPRNATFCVALIAKQAVQLMGLTIPALILLDNTVKTIEKKLHYKFEFVWITNEAPPKKEKITDFFPTVPHDLSNSTSNISDSGVSTLTDSTSIPITFSKLKMSDSDISGQNSSSAIKKPLADTKTGKADVDEPPCKKQRPNAPKKKHPKKKNKKKNKQ